MTGAEPPFGRGLRGTSAASTEGAPEVREGEGPLDDEEPFRQPAAVAKSAAASTSASEPAMPKRRKREKPPPQYRGPGTAPRLALTAHVRNTAAAGVFRTRER
jgi:hypothetical protein